VFLCFFDRVGLLFFFIFELFSSCFWGIFFYLISLHKERKRKENLTNNDLCFIKHYLSLLIKPFFGDSFFLIKGMWTIYNEIWYV
jgi:hypothetical protein